MQQLIEKFHHLQINKDLFLYSADLKKAYDFMSRAKLRKVLSEYGIDGSLLNAIKSLYANSEVAVHVDGCYSLLV